MATKKPDESLTPYTEALRTLINLSESFRGFIEMGPVLQRVADVESAIPKAKQTLDNIAYAIDTANAELGTVNGTLAKAKQQYEATVAALTQKATETQTRLSTATRKAQADYEARVKELEQAGRDAEAAHAIKLADFVKAEQMQRALLQGLNGQIERAQQQLQSLRELVGGKAG